MGHDDEPEAPIREETSRQGELFGATTSDDEGFTADEREQLRRDEAGFYIGQMRNQLGTARRYRSRFPCPRCATTDAWLRLSGGQNSVRCASCGSHLYNAPKTETGQVAKTAKTVRRGVKPSQQARILERDHGRCLLCGGRDDLHIGHLLSVDDGAALGVDERLLNADANLAAMCRFCNEGLGRRSVSARTYAVFTWHLLEAEALVGRSPSSGRHSNGRRST